MGYRIFLRHASFVIRPENTEPAYGALRAMFAERLADAMTLEDAMLRFGWQVDPDVNGGIDGIYPATADLGDHRRVLVPLIPFVEHGSFIEMEGADGHRWRWEFAHRHMLHERRAVIAWDTHTTWTGGSKTPRLSRR